MTTGRVGSIRNVTSIDNAGRGIAGRVDGTGQYEIIGAVRRAGSLATRSPTTPRRTAGGVSRSTGASVRAGTTVAGRLGTATRSSAMAVRAAAVSSKAPSTRRAHGMRSPTGPTTPGVLPRVAIRWRCSAQGAGTATTNSSTPPRR
jgi:hypothetical protein